MDTVTVTLNQDDLNAIMWLSDHAIKATGLQGAKMATPVLAKIEMAVAKVNEERNAAVAKSTAPIETDEGHA